MEPEQNTPTTENAFPPAAEASSKNTLLISGVAVVVILAGLGWYMLQSVSTEVPVETPVALTPETTQVVEQTPAATTSEQSAAATPDAATAALSTQGTSDELTAIDADLKATDLAPLGDISKI